MIRLAALLQGTQAGASLVACGFPGCCMERVRGCDGGGGTAKVWKQAGRCLSQPGHLKDDGRLLTGLLLAPHVENMSVSTSRF